MLKKIFKYLNVQTELEDYETIHNQILQGVVFKGTNLWILMFAIVIASVGLNTNSTAVIIGAMLISPLMGPINGMGYSIATYDFTLFRKSAKNFSFAVVTALLTSTVYFAISPVSTADSELLARTSPTIYDVLIALFGGLAGILAISSKLKGNVIPGAAIATALMPPLCTAGYGIANGEPYYFLGALYLFTINTVFIGLSSVAISQILKFQISSNVIESHKRRINRYITAVILLTLLPSIYFGYKLVQNEKFTAESEKFTESVTYFEGAYLIKSEIQPETKTIRLIYGGNEINGEHKENILKRAKDFDIGNAEIVIDQGFSLTQKDLNETDVLKNNISSLNLSIQKKQNIIDSIRAVQESGKDLFTEIKAIFPQVTSCTYSGSLNYNDSNYNGEAYGLVVVTAPKNKINTGERSKLNEWLHKRLKADRLKLIIDEY
ncbi:MAG TPA: DUF389 domain-containing protein [Ignavibacteria bacterium]|nr:DUF389 domain-containing protein [Ignavibacteria bacterium]HMQ99437.1 DUF389 domain-containing protein [Ignavibacteria bacterium]